MLLFPAGYFHFSKKAASDACGYPDSPTRLLRKVPQAPFEHRFSICGCAFLRTLFAPVPGALFRVIGCRESRHSLVLLEYPKMGYPPGRRSGKTPPQFFPSATVATVATVPGVPLKTPSRPLRASRFTRLLQTRVRPPPCRSAGYAVRRAWFYSHTSPDVLPASGWRSHLDVW